jgi:hypothetical protein
MTKTTSPSTGKPSLAPPNNANVGLWSGGVHPSIPATHEDCMHSSEQARWKYSIALSLLFWRSIIQLDVTAFLQKPFRPSCSHYDAWICSTWRLGLGAIDSECTGGLHIRAGFAHGFVSRSGSGEGNVKDRDLQHMVFGPISIYSRGREGFLLRYWVGMTGVAHGQSTAWLLVRGS